MQKYFYTNTWFWATDSVVGKFPFKGRVAPIGMGFLVTIKSDNFFLLAITLVKG